MTKKHLLILALVVVIGLPVLGYFDTQTGGFRQVITRGEVSQDMMGAEPAVSRLGIGGNGSSGMVLPPDLPYYDEGFTPDVDRTIIRRANLGIVVPETRQAVDQITQLAQQAGGLVTSTNVYENGFDDGGVNADLTIRIPVDQLDSTLDQIKQLATKVTSENVTADDQTEQRVDLEAQLRNLRATEAQFLEILQDATTVQDTLTVQRELNNTRTQIERLEAQLENIEGAAAMSTISVFITTQESELPIFGPDQDSILEEVKTAFRDAVRLYRNLFVSGLKLSIVGLPVIVVIGLIYLFTRKRK
jgi:hypothetical protein